MKTMLKLAGLLLLLCGSTGCISVMKKEAFEGPMVHTGDQVNKINADMAAKTALYQAVSSKTSTPKAAPYPELGRLLGQMSAAQAVAAKSRQRMFVMEKEFTDLRQGRPDISSDRPQWVPFMKLYEEMKAMVPRVNQEIQAYSDLSNQFSGLYNSHGIMNLQVAQIKGQLSGNLEALDKTVVDIRGQSAAMKQKLQERTSATLGLDRQKERNAIVDRIRALTDQLEAAAAALKGKVGAFEATIQGKTEIWQGPGFPKIGIIAEVTKDMERISGLTGQITAEAQKWNAMNK